MSRSQLSLDPMFARKLRYPEFALAAFALAALYFAVMSGHLHSIDGLLVYRQAQSLAFEGSVTFGTPLWTDASWTTSRYGIGLSLLYVPGLWVASLWRPFEPLVGSVAFDPVLYYTDPYYGLVAGPIHVAITVAAAYLVALSCLELGLGRRIGLWGMVLYGLGSPALIYARGDWNQQLTALCWIAAIYGALRFRRTGSSGLMLCAAALTYALLTRLAEGMLVSVAVLILLWPGAGSPLPARVARVGMLGALGGIAAGLGIALVVSWARFGSPFASGYNDASWTNPVWIGLIGSTITPARGIFWEFPAALLLPAGLLWLLKRTQWRIAIALGALTLLQLVSVAAWMWWWGGWNYGLRLFVPALPVVALLAACGLARLPALTRNRAAALLTLGGLLFSVPCLLADLSAGYGREFNGTADSFRPEGHPLASALGYVHRLVPTEPTDMHAVDIAWVRMVMDFGWPALLPMIGALALAAFFAARTVGAARAIPNEGGEEETMLQAAPGVRPVSAG